MILLAGLKAELLTLLHPLSDCPVAHSGSGALRWGKRDGSAGQGSRGAGRTRLAFASMNLRAGRARLAGAPRVGGEARAGSHLESCLPCFQLWYRRVQESGGGEVPRSGSCPRRAGLSLPAVSRRSRVVSSGCGGVGSRPCLKLPRGCVPSGQRAVQATAASRPWGCTFILVGTVFSWCLLSDQGLNLESPES